jgi:peptide/nickel transport system substrate-binding protein
VDLSTQRSLAGQLETLLLNQTPVIYGYFYDHLSATAKTVADGPTVVTRIRPFLWLAPRTVREKK